MSLAEVPIKDEATLKRACRRRSPARSDRVAGSTVKHVLTWEVGP